MNSLTVLELGQDLLPLSQTEIQGPFLDGDSIEYISVVHDHNDTAASFPGGIQINIAGENAAGDILNNVVAFSYTNDCNAFPVFGEGSTNGWIEFVSS